MKLASAFMLLLQTVVCRATAIEATLHTAGKDPNGGSSPTLLSNFNGWVNPEDLIPMPQCIAQQNQSAWLSTMTKCTHKRCTSHFGVICTHHQWLTHLGCLSTEFSPNVVKDYLPYCSRSTLGKTQLYHWIRSTTGRTWLVDVGDANELQFLSPASLAKGYAPLERTYDAPTCLKGSQSTPSTELFRHVIGSCSFASTTQRVGNVARPWEYSQSLGTMITLGFEIVGYDLAGHSIRDGNYFDKECFCNAFIPDWKHEPCSGLGQIDLTRERLWLNATCGPAYLPVHWIDELKIIGFPHIPFEDWRWPTCFPDMPKQVTGLTFECETDFCALDSSGYCEIRHGIDRTCFCRNISYDSCGGSCKTFETRMEYVRWLHDLCGNVQDWHGLPDNWRQLAAPLPLDMIPWRWAIKPSNDSNGDASVPGSGAARTVVKCIPTSWKLGSLAVINMAAFLATFLFERKGIHRIAPGLLWRPHPWHWFVTGILIAASQLLANCANGFIVQRALGFKDVPVDQLILLWCSMPRFGRLTILPGAASSLFAEVIIQVLSSYYMFLTVNYGQEHNFYTGSLESVKGGQWARTMYAGALMWFIVIMIAFAQSLRTIYRANKLKESARGDLPRWQRSQQITADIVEDLGHQWGAYCAWLKGKSTHCGTCESRAPSERPSAGIDRANFTIYGTLPIENKDSWAGQSVYDELYTIMAMSMVFLWLSQWVFWVGFTVLSSEEFCLPKLGLLTAVWIVSAFVGSAVGVSA